jgi:integrase
MSIRPKAINLHFAGHTYNIYPQPTTPAIDMHMHMIAWLDFYSNFLLKRPLQPDDYIFPTIGANGVSVHPDRPLSSDMVQKKILETATKAGIKGAEKFTTHCFRRGGAQYRFMYAPMSKRWSLAQIRWWGGWAQGEHVSLK